MADEPNNRASDTPDKTEEQHAEPETAIVDEYGEPLHDEHEHVRKRPLYKRPAFLIAAGVILLLVGAIPAWPYSRGWGYGPSGGLGVVLLILIILLLTGRI